MRLSGIDPGIIRELSGIYKPFVKAFKELISNAYDADASEIVVGIAEDYSSISVEDNGTGMTPFQFHREFARIGGSTAWLRGGKSPGGRARIGHKGIGFLAVARYCEGLEVHSRSVRPYRGSATVVRRNRKLIPFTDFLGDLVETRLLRNRVKVTHVSVLDSSVKLTKGRDFATTDRGLSLRSARAQRAKKLEVRYEVDCRRLELRARLDFVYLLGLERQADLQLLEDFCTIELVEHDSQVKQSFTTVHLRGLHEFVVRELSAPPLKGKARNIASKSGKDQFLWRLARSSPIVDTLPSDLKCAPIKRLHRIQQEAELPTLKVRWGDGEPVELGRQIYAPRNKRLSLNETVIPVDIRKRGLRVVGYLLAQSEIIYPAELRGLSIRVRNVAIGDASFLEWDRIMSGPRKAAMSQITGELLVLEGIDAADAINPGRESFYEENHHFRAIKQELFGSEESMGGVVGLAIKSILDRIRVRSQVAERVTAAKERRRTFTDISGAVNYFSREDPDMARAFSGFFRKRVEANGLKGARSVEMRPAHKLGGFELEQVDGLSAEYQIDYKRRRVRIDFEQDTWDSSVYLGGNYYDVVFKNGKPDHPVCEFDNKSRKIYVNWAHPVKLHMDEIGFLRSAILLRLAYHASPSDANTMMNLAMRMLAYRAE